MKHRGFTLIEVLVVVAVIALLIAILLPSLARAREVSRRTVCLHDLHMISQAWTLYHADNKGALISAYANVPPPNDIYNYFAPPWVLFINYTPAQAPVSVQIDAIRKGALFKYSRVTDVYRCPATKRNEVLTYGSNVGVADPRPWDPATKQFGNPTQPGAYRIDHISRPQARIVYVDDGPEDWNNCWGIWYDRPAFWNRLEMRHDKGTTLGFCDGHSELWRWVEQDTINYMSQPWEQVETLIATNVQKKTNRDLRRLQIGVFGKLGWQ